MIIVIAKWTVDRFSNNFWNFNARALVATSREEEGCTSYILVDTVFLESYKDETALEAHKQSKHYKFFVSKLEMVGTCETTVLHI